MKIIRILLTVLPVILLFTAPLRAQQTSLPPKEEKKRGEIGAGVHLSISSFIYAFKSVSFDPDPLPVPQGGANVRYNGYQGIVEYTRDANESLLRVTARYNFEMNKQTTFKAREYVYGGIDLWYFSRSERELSRNENHYFKRSAEETSIYENNSPMNRPSGQSTTLGFNGGLGIELRFWHLGLFIEAGIAVALCSESYQDFICGGAHTSRTKGGFGDYRLGLNTHF